MHPPRRKSGETRGPWRPNDSFHMMDLESPSSVGRSRPIKTDPAELRLNAGTIPRCLRQNNVVPVQYFSGAGCEVTFGWAGLIRS